MQGVLDLDFCVLARNANSVILVRPREEELHI